MSKKTDAAVVEDKDGNLSNSALHEQMTAGVDDSKFVSATRKRLKKLGVSEEDLDRVCN